VAVSLACGIRRLGGGTREWAQRSSCDSVGSDVDYTVDALRTMLDRPANGINRETVERHMQREGVFRPVTEVNVAPLYDVEDRVDKGARQSESRRAVAR
jgi:hypothetical protein